MRRLLSRACKETRRAKAKVWNIRDLDRARSIPAPVSSTTGEDDKKGSVAIKRLSAAGTARRLSSGSNTNMLKSSDSPKTREEGGGKGGGSGVGRGAAVADEKAELERRREERAAQALAK